MAQEQIPLKKLFNEIVDAIHYKDHLTDGIAAEDFPARIRAISSYNRQPNVWCMSHIPSSYGLTSLCFAKGIFVAGSQSGKWTLLSEDGENWEAISMPSSNTYSAKILTFKNKFVSIGSNHLHASDDGREWKTTAVPPSFNVSYAVASDERMIVAWNSSNTNIVNKIGITSDLMSWTSLNLSLGNSATKFLGYANGKFIIATTKTFISDGDDGFTWTEITLPIQDNWYNFLFGNGKYILWGQNHYLLTTDFENWEVYDITFNCSMPNICFTGQRFITIGPTESYESEDCINWTELNGVWPESWKAIAHGNNKTLLVNYNNYVTGILYDS